MMKDIADYAGVGLYTVNNIETKIDPCGTPSNYDNKLCKECVRCPLILLRLL